MLMPEQLKKRVTGGKSVQIMGGRRPNAPQLTLHKPSRQSEPNTMPKRQRIKKKLVVYEINGSMGCAWDVWTCSARRLGLALGAEHQTCRTLLSSSSAPHGTEGSRHHLRALQTLLRSCHCGKALRTQQGTSRLEEKKKTDGKKNNPERVGCKEMYGWQVLLVPLPGIKITSDCLQREVP